MEPAAYQMQKEGIYTWEDWIRKYTTNSQQKAYDRQWQEDENEYYESKYEIIEEKSQELILTAASSYETIDSHSSEEKETKGDQNNNFIKGPNNNKHIAEEMLEE